MYGIRERETETFLIQLMGGEILHTLLKTNSTTHEYNIQEGTTGLTKSLLIHALVHTCMCVCSGNLGLYSQL